MKIYYNSLILGEIEKKEELENFLKEKFIKEEQLVFMGDEEFYPIWAEWYEDILFKNVTIPNNYIELTPEWYIDKDYIEIIK